MAQQWKNELRYKFDLYADLFPKDGANHVILSLEEIAPRHPALQETWDLLVVDETHRLLCDNLRYSLIFSVSKVVQNVLLLSATPIQNRKTEYLNLLRLLLPTQYEDMSLEDFSKLLRNQKKLQRKVNGMLRHMEDYENYREDIYDQLDELADTLEDNYLKKLLTQFDADTEGPRQKRCRAGHFFYYRKLSNSTESDPEPPQIHWRADGKAHLDGNLLSARDQ